MTRQGLVVSSEREKKFWVEGSHGKKNNKGYASFEIEKTKH
jgi:hypothetical protein